MWCDVSTGRIQPLVPPAFRRSVFDAHHGLSHGGTRPTVKLIKSRFVWPDIQKDVRQWCRDCLACQASKVGRLTMSPITIDPPAASRFRIIHVDLVGPLPASKGCKYLLTVVDCFSRWPEAFPLQDMSSGTCSKAFVQNWLPRYGIPDEIITDRGSQFLGGSWKELMTSLGIDTKSTTSYHPQCNGLVERMHRQLKSSIRARLIDNAWQDALPLVLLGLRSAWREGPETAPAELLCGSALRLPGQFVPGPELCYAVKPNRDERTEEMKRC